MLTSVKTTFTYLHLANNIVTHQNQNTNTVSVGSAVEEGACSHKTNLVNNFKMLIIDALIQKNKVQWKKKTKKRPDETDGSQGKCVKTDDVMRE